MTPWKQFILSAAALAAGAASWVAFFPGSDDVLAKAGLSAPRVQARPEAPRPQRPPAIVTSTVTASALDQTVTAMGTGRAARTVAVMPLGSGTVSSVAVDSGSVVHAGKLIARLDSDAEEIALRKAATAAADAQAALDRATRLYHANAGTAVQVQDAEIALRNAMTAADEAALALARRSVIAPIDGSVGIVHVQQGEQVTTQTLVARIEDRSSILVDFWIHEAQAGMVVPGHAVKATSPAWPGETFEGTVEAVDGAVDEASRTLQARARIPNPDGRLRASS